MTQKLAIPFVVLIGACSTGDDAPDEVVRRDSAGIAIVESPAAFAAQPTGWTLDTVPEVDIGTLDGDPAYQLFRVTGIAGLPDGGIAIVNAGTQEVRFYSADGAFVRAVGRRGDGPGEFQFPALLRSAVYDSVHIHDFGNGGRVTTLTAAGDIAGIVTPRSFTPNVVGRLENGVLVFTSSTATAGPESPEAILDNNVVYAALNSASGVPDTILRLPAQKLLRWRLGERFGFTPVPFDVAPAAAVSRVDILVTPGKEPEARSYDATGSLLSIFRVLVPPEPLDRARFEAEVEARLASADDANEVAELRRRYAKMQMPDVVPAFERVVFDEAGFIWVERFRADDSAPRDWIVFDASGRVIGRIEVPARLVIEYIGPDHLLARWRDHVDVEHAGRFRLARDID